MLKKINRLISLLNNDRRSFHHIEINRAFVKRYFDFFINEKKLSENSINRIFNFAKNIIDDDKRINKNDLWNTITSQNDHKELLNACLKRDLKNFEKIIYSANKTKLTQGFLNYYNYNDLISSQKNRFKESVQFIDKLLSIAEYKKDIVVFNPEQGKWAASENDYKDLIKKVFYYNKKLIKPFDSPNFTFGFKSDENFYSLKDLKSFYTAIRINEISKKHGFKEINEIGAGLGFLPYYSSKLNKIKYNIFDLPLILILQSYYLILSLGDEKIHLYGERKKDSNIISLNPFWLLFESEANEVLWVNQDSLPEIDASIAKKYIDIIFSSKKSCFLSINQEARDINISDTPQQPVYELINKNIDQYLVYRSRDFLRKGYIEELYQIN